MLTYRWTDGWTDVRCINLTDGFTTHNLLKRKKRIQNSVLPVGQNMLRVHICPPWDRDRGKSIPVILHSLHPLHCTEIKIKQIPFIQKGLH